MISKKAKKRVLKASKKKFKKIQKRLSKVSLDSVISVVEFIIILDDKGILDKIIEAILTK